MNQLEIKRKLYSLCEEYVNQKINSSQEAIDNAQNSANRETKSSSGDKYETGRSMMQLEIEKYSSQLSDGISLKKVLNQIDVEKSFKTVQSGSLVMTSNGNFFISISAGAINIDGTYYTAISFSSPLCQAMFNKNVKDEIIFRGKTFIIKSIV